MELDGQEAAFIAGVFAMAFIGFCVAVFWVV